MFFRLLLLLALFLSPLTAQGDGHVRGTLQGLRPESSGYSVFLSLETPEGLEQFRLAEDSSAQASASLRHFKGVSRPRRGRPFASPAAATVIGDRVLLFYTSSRLRRPASASFIIGTEGGGRLSASVPRLAAAGLFSLPCASGRAHALRRGVRDRRRAMANPLSDLGAQAFYPPRVVEVATRADFAFYRIYGPSSNDYIAASLYAAEVLYAAPLGIRFSLLNQGVVASGPGAEPVVDAGLLLDSFRHQLMGERGNADIYHLFTGRELAGRTIGIAYVRSACSGRPRFNVGLSKSITAALQPILVAHEIAHNLGASHDEEPGSVMGPVLSPANDHFSQRSLADMKAAVSRYMPCISRMADHRTVLALDRSSPGSLVARVEVQSGLSQQCSLSLLGQLAENGRAVGPVVRLKEILYTSVPGYTSNVVTFSAANPPDPASQAEIALRVMLRCRSRSFFSNSSSFALSASPAVSGAPATAREWLAALQRNFREQ